MSTSDPGALNAAVASAMTRLLQPTARDVFVNLCCGSGSLLIERAAHGPAARLIGLDIASTALALCRANLNAAGSGCLCVPIPNGTLQGCVNRLVLKGCRHVWPD